MPNIDGSPQGITLKMRFLEAGVFVWRTLDNTWGGIGNPPYVDRFTVNRQGAGINRASPFSFTIKQLGGGAAIHDWIEVQAQDISNGLTYYYGGYTQLQKSYREAAGEQVWECTCTSYHILLTKGSKTITDKIHIPAGQTDTLILGGGTWVVPAWAAATVYTQAQTVKPTTSPVYYYECAGPGAHTFSTTRIYKLGKGVVPTTGSPNAWFELTTAGGAATAEPNWASAPSVGNTVSLGGNTWTNRGDPAIPLSGAIEPGHSGADPWPTVVGQTVPWGNVTWRCMGTLAWGGILPTYVPELTNLGLNTLITSAPSFDWQNNTVLEVLDALRATAPNSLNVNYSVWVDNSGNPAFTWFDLNNPTYTPTTTDYLSDETGNASHRLHYDKFERTIDGQQVVNSYAVSGDPQSGASWYVDGSIVGGAFTASASTDFITLVGHGFNNGDTVFFYNPVLAAGDALPAPLIQNAALIPAVTYYVRNKTVNTFQVSLTPAGAIINLTTNGTGANWVSASDHFDYYAHQSYLYYGRVITKKADADTTLLTNADCLARCQAVVGAYYKARDTIQVGVANTTVDGLGLPIPRKIPVTNSMEGLSLTPYAIVRDTISPDGSAGTFRHDLDLGDAFEDNNTRGIQKGLGQGFVSGGAIPPHCTWPDQPVITNTLVGGNTVNLHIQWDPETIGNLFQYQLRASGAGTGVGRLDEVLQPQTDFIYYNLQPNQPITIELRCMTIEGDWSEPFASTWPNVTITTAGYLQPPTSVAVFRNVYNEQTHLSDLALSYTASVSVGVTGYVVYTQLTGDQRVQRDAVGLNLTPTIHVPPGNSFTLWVTSLDAYGNESVMSNQVTGTTAIASYLTLPNPGFESADVTDSTLPQLWTRTVANGGTMTRGGPAHSGGAALRLLTINSAGSSASGTSALVAAAGAHYALSFWAVANFSSVAMTWLVTWYAADGVTPTGTSTNTETLGTSYARFTHALTPPASTFYWTIKFTNAVATGRDVSIDDVGMTAQTPTDGLEDKVVTVDKTLFQASFSDPLIDYDDLGQAAAWNYFSPASQTMTHLAIGSNPTYTAIGHEWLDATGAAMSLQGGLFRAGGPARLGDAGAPTANASIRGGTASAGTAPMKIDSGTLMTTPEAGASEYDGTNFYDTPVGERYRRLLGTSPITTVATWSNSAVESGALYTGAIAAKQLKVGRTVIMKMWAIYQETLGGTDTGTLRVKTGGNLSFSVALPAVTAAKPIYIEYWMTTYSTGTSGNAWQACHARVNGVVTDQSLASVATVDTTVAQDITVTFQWSAAHTTSIFTITQAMMEIH